MSGLAAVAVGFVVWQLVASPRIWAAAPGLAGGLGFLGLDGWTPVNLGGLVGLGLGTCFGGRVGRLTGKRDHAVLALLLVTVWVSASIWLFYGVRIEDFGGQATGG